MAKLTEEQYSKLMDQLQGVFCLQDLNMVNNLEIPDWIQILENLGVEDEEQMIDIIELEVGWNREDVMEHF